MAKRKKVKRPVVPFTMNAMVGAVITVAGNPAPGNNEVTGQRKPNARKVGGVFTVYRVNVPMPTINRGASYRFAVGATKADAKRWNPLARQSTSAHGEVSTGDVTAKGNVRWAYGAPRSEMRCRSGDEISSGRWRQAG